MRVTGLSKSWLPNSVLRDSWSFLCFAYHKVFSSDTKCGMGISLQKSRCLIRFSTVHVRWEAGGKWAGGIMFICDFLDTLDVASCCGWARLAYKSEMQVGLVSNRFLLGRRMFENMVVTIDSLAMSGWQEDGSEYCFRLREKGDLLRVFR